MVQRLCGYVTAEVGLVDSVAKALKITFAVSKLLLPKLVLRNEVNISVTGSAHILDNLDLYQFLLSAYTALFRKKSISSASGERENYYGSRRMLFSVYFYKSAKLFVKPLCRGCGGDGSS